MLPLFLCLPLSDLTYGSFCGDGASDTHRRLGLVASIRILADDAAVFTLHEHICIDLCPKVFHVALKAFFRDRHEPDHIGDFAEVHGREVGVDVVAFFQIIEILAEG